MAHFGRERTRLIGAGTSFASTSLSLDTHANRLMDTGDSSGKRLVSAKSYRKARHVVLSFDGARHGCGLGVAAWVLWVREAGSFEKVSHGGRVLRHNSAMVAELEAVRMDIERLAVLLPTKVSLFVF